jgi:hypothetical protein
MLRTKFTQLHVIKMLMDFECSNNLKLRLGPIRITTRQICVNVPGLQNRINVLPITPAVEAEPEVAEAAVAVLADAEVAAEVVVVALLCERQARFALKMKLESRALAECSCGQQLQLT